jgi:hypothetical protein
MVQIAVLQPQSAEHKAAAAKQARDVADKAGVQRAVRSDIANWQKKWIAPLICSMSEPPRNLRQAISLAFAARPVVNWCKKPMSLHRYVALASCWLTMMACVPI